MENVRKVPSDVTTTEIVFLFIGGAHQVFHLAPVAAELSRLLPDTPVICLAADEAVTAALHRVREVLATPGLCIETARVPTWGRMFSALTGRKSSLKRPLLLSLRRRLRNAAAVVTPERMARELPPVFENGNRTVLYNPHFDVKGSSLPVAEQVIRRFMDRSSYNLIFAPHIRTAEKCALPNGPVGSNWQSLTERSSIWTRPG